MKTCFVSLLLSAVLLLFGCYPAPLSLENGGEKIASSLGETTENLKFVSHAGIVPTDALLGRNLTWSHGIIAVSADTIYWQTGEDEFDIHRSIRQIPIQSISEFAPDGDLIQMRIGEKLHLVRFIGWSSSTASQPRAEAFTDILLAHGVPQFTASQSFRPSLSQSRRIRSSSSLDADYESSVEAGLAQDSTDREYNDWAASFGEEGVPTREPGRQL